MATPRYKISLDVHYQEVDGEVVLLNMATQRYLGLNRVGSEIWNQLAEHGDAEKASTWVAQRYSIGADTAERDVRTLVGDLLAAGLIAES